jgi:hypothetical protein
MYYAILMKKCVFCQFQFHCYLIACTQFQFSVFFSFLIVSVSVFRFFIINVPIIFSSFSDG